MFIHYRTRGLIFKKEDRGETNELLTIYTKDFGKLKILGKAIKKIKSKLRSGAELFYLSEIEFIQGKTHKTLTDAISIEEFKNLKKNLRRLQIAYKISEILDKFIRGQESDERIWQLLIETFDRLNAPDLKPSICDLQYYYFFWNLLSFLGYQPQLYNCVLCQKRLTPENLYFNQKEGGLICEKCFKKVKSGIEVKPEVVKILRVIFEKNWVILSRLKIGKFHLNSLKTISKICEENLSSS